MTSEAILNAIKALYTEFDRQSEIYEELMDTDVRESIHMTLNYYFVWGNELDRLPISYGMFSYEGDKSVANVVNSFLSYVSNSSELSEIPVGKERLAMLQNLKITTLGGYQYDDFIGHSDEPLPSDELPEDLFEEGDYDDEV